MIQRIQTIYLLLIAGLMLAMLFMPLASFPSAQGVLSVWGASMVSADVRIVMAALLISIALNAVSSALMYKNRSLQLRMCTINLVQILLTIGFLLYVVWNLTGNLLPVGQMKIAMAFPAVVFILDLLAIAAIRKDDQLVKSLDRIR